MGNDYNKGLIRSLIGIMILTMCYFSSCGDLLGRTYKNYYYSKDGKYCLTIIVYTAGDAINIIKSCTVLAKQTIYTDETMIEDYGRGIYIIPGKFNGRLPKDNYVRLDYIGTSPTNPIYFRWENDSLTVRLANWSGVIIENKLNPEVKVDMEFTDYEICEYKNGEIDKKAKDRWENLKNEYQYVLNRDLRLY